MSVKFKKLTYNFVYFDIRKIVYILKSKYLVYNLIPLTLCALLFQFKQVMEYK